MSACVAASTHGTCATMATAFMWLMCNRLNPLNAKTMAPSHAPAGENPSRPNSTRPPASAAT